MKQLNLVSKLKKNVRKRKNKIRKKVTGTEVRPRVSMFRSNKSVYAQVINDELGATVVSISSFEKDFKEKKNNIETATELGKKLGERMKSKGISRAVFDRNGKRYHGRIKAFADGIRESGIQV